MSIFTDSRLPIELFAVDSRLQKGWFSDQYLLNIKRVLIELAKEGYEYDIKEKGYYKDGVKKFELEEDKTKTVMTGELHVRMQIFTSRKPYSIVAGTDEALAILKKGTGYFEDEDQEKFVNTYDDLEVWAVQDGEKVYYNGDKKDVSPVMVIKGRYSDFCYLETPILGVLSEPTRIATNIYRTLEVTNGKGFLFFPARFTHYKSQARHGYACDLAINRYNQDYDQDTSTIVSTHEQGAWWGGKGGGTTSHSMVACFLGNTTELMMQFCKKLDVEVPRIPVIDFNNHCVNEAKTVLTEVFRHYMNLKNAGKHEEAKKFEISGIRPDTSGNIKDESIVPFGDPKLDFGVNARLVFNLRKMLDELVSYEWDFLNSCEENNWAKEWVNNIKIVVTGGFNREKIAKFEKLDVPVDMYGVGSALLENSSATGTNNDFTADVTEVRIGDTWLPMAKVGRKTCWNEKLEFVSSCAA